MTTIETAVRGDEKVDFRTLELKIGEYVKIQGREEIVIGITITESYDNRKRLERFRTIRREEDGGITESGYSVNGNDGKEHLDYSGVPPRSSQRYQELNEFLQKLGK